jgi:hypothetical protein
LAVEAAGEEVVVVEEAEEQPQPQPEAAGRTGECKETRLQSSLEIDPNRTNSSKIFKSTEWLIKGIKP